MPVYLFTFHAYRSWMPDHPRGYVRRRQGILPPDTATAVVYRQRAKHDRVVFTDELCEQLILAVREACRDQRWRLHQAVAVWSHVHILVSWRSFRDAKLARKALKHRLTTHLRDVTGRHHPWFSRAGSIKPVLNREHFDRLMHNYLPAHTRFGGSQWSENTANTTLRL